MSCFFERVKRFSADESIIIPERKTKYSAGYDFAVAEDTVIKPYKSLWIDFDYKISKDGAENYIIKEQRYTLNQMAELTKQFKTRPTLVPTGIKCCLPKDCYLELSMRSSIPLKTGLIMANSQGIIDCDYYNNPDNDGEIFFQLINLSPFSIMLKKGNIIGQGIIKHYYKVDNDAADGERVGGFGSTSNE